MKYRHFKIIFRLVKVDPNTRFKGLSVKSFKHNDLTLKKCLIILVFKLYNLSCHFVQFERLEICNEIILI